MGLKLEFSHIAMICCNVMLKIYISIAWRIKNQHNETYPSGDFFQRKTRVTVGKGTYGKIDILDSNPGKNELIIGNYCSIADKVKFILCGEHDYKYLSTFPFRTKILHEELHEAVSHGNIVIKDDVWIGYGTIIMSGVTIGQGAIVAAGSVVTKDIPEYAIVGGVPAKIIRYRFDDFTISKLKEVDFSRITPEIVKSKKDIFCSSDIDNDIDRFLYEICKEEKP